MDPFFTHRLQGLLDLGVEGAALERDDLRGRIRVVGDRGAALGAEDAVDGVARGALAGPGLGRAVDLELVLGDDADEGLFCGQPKFGCLEGQRGRDVIRVGGVWGSSLSLSLSLGELRVTTMGMNHDGK